MDPQYVHLKPGEFVNRAEPRRSRKIPEWRGDDFRALVDCNVDGMVVLDYSGFVLYVNPAAEALFSMTSAEMVGAMFGFPIIVDQPVELYILKGFRDFISAEMRLAEVVWAGEPAYLLTFRDLTDRVIAEQAVSQARDELEVKVKVRTGELTAANERLKLEIAERKQAEKALRETKEQAELYIDLMSHDINNLNHSALGFLELALETLEIDGKIGRDGKLFIEKPLQAITSSSKLIENVRILQQLTTEGVKTRPIDLCSLFDDLKGQDFHVEGREVTIRFESIPHYIVEGSELLREVFYNLISNAVKHSLPDKAVAIDVKVEPAAEGGHSYYKCIVEDDGPGIPDEMKPRLFHRFQRGKTKARGKGLGLYLVRTLVESYHGRVWVEDRVPGDHTKGARFVVMLPATTE